MNTKATPCSAVNDTIWYMDWKCTLYTFNPCTVYQIASQHFRTLSITYETSNDVNKDLTLKAKAKDSTVKAKANNSAFKAKDRTFEGLNRELDI